VLVICAQCLSSILCLRVGENLNIGIVGLDARKWKKEKVLVVQEVVEAILCGRELEPYVKGDSRVVQAWLYQIQRKITLVSGDCPIGVRGIFCIDCNKWLTGGEIGYHRRFLFHKAVEAYSDGGVDTWAKISAVKLGVSVRTFPAVCTSTSSSIETCKQKYAKEDAYVKRQHFWNYHYKPRNLKIARSLDVGYCLTQAVDEQDALGYCYHCDVKGHTQSGGCYVMKKARKLGKEVYVVVI